MNRPLMIAVGCSLLFSLIFLLLSIAAFRKRRILGGLVSTLCGLLLLTLAACFGMVGIGLQGYRAFTHEEVAAVITTAPTGAQRFDARFRLPSGEERLFELAGDQIYVDAHILKWHPIANLIGIHTGYELDRVGGRYADLADEQHGTRTVYAFSEKKPVDLFSVVRRYTFLAPLVDAEYGSAVFTDVRRPSQFEVSVSTSGLVIRKLGGVDE